MPADWVRCVEPSGRNGLLLRRRRPCNLRHVQLYEADADEKMPALASVLKRTRGALDPFRGGYGGCVWLCAERRRRWRRRRRILRMTDALTTTMTHDVVTGCVVVCGAVVVTPPPDPEDDTP